MRANKIAVLVPVYQSGALLGETLVSALRAGLPADSNEFVVADTVAAPPVAAPAGVLPKGCHSPRVTFEGEHRDPRWTPDGRGLVFASRAGGARPG